MAESNVATLPRRRASPRRKPSGATQPCQVLNFPGRARFIYDRDEVLRAHKKAMLDHLNDIMGRVQRDEFTGLMIVAPRGNQANSINLSVAGLFVDQPAFAERAAGKAAEKVIEVIEAGKKSPGADSAANT